MNNSTPSITYVNSYFREASQGLLDYVNFIASLANRYDMVFPSQTRSAQEAHRCVKTIYRYEEELWSQSLLVKTNRPRKTNIIYLHPIFNNSLLRAILKDKIPALGRLTYGQLMVQYQQEDTNVRLTINNNSPCRFRSIFFYSKYITYLQSKTSDRVSDLDCTRVSGTYNSKSSIDTKIVRSAPNEDEGRRHMSKTTIIDKAAAMFGFTQHQREQAEMYSEKILTHAYQKTAAHGDPSRDRSKYFLAICRNETAKEEGARAGHSPHKAEQAPRIEQQKSQVKNDLKYKTPREIEMMKAKMAEDVSDPVYRELLSKWLDTAVEQSKMHGQTYDRPSNNFMARSEHGDYMISTPVAHSLPKSDYPGGCPRHSAAGMSALMWVQRQTPCTCPPDERESIEASPLPMSNITAAKVKQTSFLGDLAPHFEDFEITDIEELP